MKGKKDLKKIFSITGIVAVAVYLVFYLITTSINMFTTINILGFNTSVLSDLWSMFRTIILFGFIGFYFIYELIKKSDNKDKVMNIILIVVFGILALTSFVGICSTIHSLVKYSRYSNGINTFNRIIIIFNHLIKIGAFVLFGINTIGLMVKKKMPTKILTFIVWGLLALILVVSFVSIILSLVSTFNAKYVLLALCSVIALLALIITEASLAFVIYNKSKKD